MSNGALRALLCMHFCCRAQRQEWCAMPKTAAPKEDTLPSSIHCYPYLQEHKRSGKKAGNREMFCEGTNIFIDFSKVRFKGLLSAQLE
jgi:hypothetical protein